MARKSMTFGVFPSREQFDEAFYEECEKGVFTFGNDERVGNDAMNCTELWDELHKAMADGAEDWCGCVLGVLGFEWI